MVGRGEMNHEGTKDTKEEREKEEEEGYSGFRSYEVHLSPFIACTGGGWADRCKFFIIGFYAGLGRQ